MDLAVWGKIEYFRSFGHNTPDHCSGGAAGMDLGKTFRIPFQNRLTLHAGLMWSRCSHRHLQPQNVKPHHASCGEGAKAPPKTRTDQNGHAALPHARSRNARQTAQGGALHGMQAHVADTATVGHRVL